MWCLPTIFRCQRDTNYKSKKLPAPNTIKINQISANLLPGLHSCQPEPFRQKCSILSWWSSSQKRAVVTKRSHILQLENISKSNICWQSYISSTCSSTSCQDWWWFRPCIWKNFSWFWIVLGSESFWVLECWFGFWISFFWFWNQPRTLVFMLIVILIVGFWTFLLGSERNSDRTIQNSLSLYVTINIQNAEQFRTLQDFSFFNLFLIFIMEHHKNPKKAPCCDCQFKSMWQRTSNYKRSGRKF